MSAPIALRYNRASAAEIADHLAQCAAQFVPPLSERVEIGEYAAKIAANAVTVEAWSKSALVGLAAAYCNDTVQGVAHLTTVSVLPGWTSRGLAAQLVDACIECARDRKMRRVTLEVSTENGRAIRLYERAGFAREGTRDGVVFMCLTVSSGLDR
jgi:ribosomal protein S18 acetylase RimI-like enzyme